MPLELSKHDARVSELLARMTVRERVGQMSQLSVGFQPVPPCQQAAREGRVGSFINRTSAESAVPQMPWQRLAAR
jgi:hypothetical protein